MDKRKRNSSLIPPSLHINEKSHLLLCPYCFVEIPLIIKIIQEGDNIYLKLKCVCLKYEAIINWFEYFQKINREFPKQQCSNHNNIEGSKYCVMCNIWLCNDCLSNHQKLNQSHLHYLFNHEIHLICYNHHYQLEYYNINTHQNICRKCKEESNDKTLQKASSINYTKFLKNHNNISDILKTENEDFNVYALKTQHEPYFTDLKTAYEINQICNTQLKQIIDVMVITYEVTKGFFNYSLITSMNSITFITQSPLKKISNNVQEVISNLVNIFIIEVTRCSERVALCNDKYSKTAQLILVLNNRRLAISNSNVIQLYEINNNSFKQLSNLKGHNDYINCIIELNDRRIASGSIDKTIKIWNLESYQCEGTLEDNEPIRCLLRLKDGRLLSSKWDMYNQISVWNVSKLKCVQKAYTYLEVRHWIQLKDNRIATSMENTIAIINHTTFETMGIMEIANNKEKRKEAIKRMLELNDGRLATSCQFSIVRIWNIETFQCQLRLQIDIEECQEPEPIRELVQLRDGRLIICKNTDISIYDCKLMKYIGIVGRVSQNIKLVTQTIKGNLLCLTDSPIKLWSIDLLTNSS